MTSLSPPPAKPMPTVAQRIGSLSGFAGLALSPVPWAMVLLVQLLHAG